MTIARVRRPIFDVGSYSYAESLGDPPLKTVTVARESARPIPPGGASGSPSAPHAPLPGEFAPPPARVVQAPAPRPAGSVQAFATAPGTDPPNLSVRSTLAREAQRPGHAGGVIRLGYAPPEEPTPAPAAVVRAGGRTPLPEGAVIASKSATPADNLPPATIGGIVRDRGRQPGGEGRVCSAGNTGPPEPRPGVGQTMASQAEPLRNAGRVIACGMYDYANAAGSPMPKVVMVYETQRPGFAGVVIRGRAVEFATTPDPITPTPDPVFEFPTPVPASITFRFRKG